jgi:HEAT repeat protein
VGDFYMDTTTSYELINTGELIELALNEKDEQDYWYIVTVLHNRGSEDVFDAALDLCESESSRDRVLGIHILAQLGTPERTFPEESVEVLLELLEYEEVPEVLHSIGVALGHYKESRAVAPLAEFKNHPNPDVRYGVVFGLLSQDDQLAIDTLIELSADDHEKVRNWATFGLGSMVDVDTPQIREALWQRILSETGDTDGQTEIRGEALVGLAIRQDKRVVKPLIVELSSSHVGILPVEAAKEIGDSKLYSALVELKEWWSLDKDLLQEAIHCCKN